jgi:hypothetical protein
MSSDYKCSNLTVNNVIIVRDDISETTAAPTNELFSSDQTRHFVLHFDINETILLGDEAGGDTRDETVHKMLAKSAFVQMPIDKQNNDELFDPTMWWDGTSIGDASSPPPPLYTKWKWPDNCCPYYRTNYKNRSKTFCQHDGAVYKPIHDAIHKRLDLNNNSAASMNDALPILSHILPAFFETLIHLSMRDEPHTVVFRTFGSDLPEIARAMTAFATGQHPLYSNFRNPDLVLLAENLYQGRWRGQGRESVYELWQYDNIVASGDAQVLALLHSKTICGIQDDYDFWKQHDYQQWAGKPVWMLNDSSKFHHLLMDDNIHNLHHDSIASVRRQVRLSDNSETFETLCSEECLQLHGVHLLRIPTIEPVLNPMWFAEQIEAIRNRIIDADDDQRIKKV